MLTQLLASIQNRIFDLHTTAFPFSEIALWGADWRGSVAKDFFQSKGIKIVLFLDNDPYLQNEYLDGIPILAPPLFLKNSFRIPIVICNQYVPAITTQLHQMEVTDFYFFAPFTENQLKNLNHAPFTHIDLTDDDLTQYKAQFLEAYRCFDDESSRQTYLSALKARRCNDYGFVRLSSFPKYKHPLVKVEPGDVIINGGGYDGETTKSFAKTGRYRCKIYTFEPFRGAIAQVTHKIIQYNLEEMAVVVPKALWDRETELQINSFEACDPKANVAEAQMPITAGSLSERITGTTLDSFVKEQNLSRVDLIKLDIEGAEMKALQGSLATIKKFRPKLQLSIYHKIRDLWEIPLWVKEAVPEYRLFVGHHRYNWTETMLYARI